jgi:hypothetical protein
MLPAQLVAGLGRIAKELIDLGRPEVAGIDQNESLSGGGIQANFVHALA